MQQDRRRDSKAEKNVLGTGGKWEEAATEFGLEGKEYIELSDLLKVTGVFDSGGMAKTAISEGLVTVDGRPELRRRCKVRTGQVVVYRNRAIAVK
jgi:ribosome-associated protein